MKFKLAVADAVEFKVKGEVASGAQMIRFDFYITGKRIPIETYRDAVKEDSGMTTRDFLREYIEGWRGQRLVLSADSDQPADFSPEAFECLLSLPGMEGLVFTAYVDSLVASSTAKGRSGN